MEILPLVDFWAMSAVPEMAAGGVTQSAMAGGTMPQSWEVEKNSTEDGLEKHCSPCDAAGPSFLHL